MGWKDLSSWLKGGIVGVVFGLLVFLIVGFISGNCLNFSDFNGNQENGLIIDSLPFYCNLLFFGAYLESPIFGIVILFVYYFLIGAIIGWIFGKFKK